MKIRLVEAELFHADRRTNMTKLVVSFLNFQKAPQQPLVFNIIHATQSYKFSVCHPEVLLTYIQYTNVSVQNTTVYFIYIKIVYSQGDMFRPSLGHLHALKENRPKITYIFYNNALWDPICSQNVIRVLYKLQKTRVCKYLTKSCNIKMLKQ